MILITKIKKVGEEIKINLILKGKIQRSKSDSKRKSGQENLIVLFSKNLVTNNLMIKGSREIKAKTIQKILKKDNFNLISKKEIKKLMKRTSITSKDKEIEIQGRIV
jgi:hypothetical protein